MKKWFIDQNKNIYFVPNNMPIGDAIQYGLVTVNVTQNEIENYSIKTLKKLVKTRKTK